MFPATRFDVVHQLEDDEAVAEVRVEMVDVGPHSERVHPVSKHLNEEVIL